MQDDDIANPRCRRIHFSEEEITKFYKPWSKTLVVRVLEKSFAYPALKCRLESLWVKIGHVQVSDLSNEFFLVQFSSVNDYHRAAFAAPWKMFDYYITVACWTPGFNEDPVKKILTWVQLPKLSIQFFNHTMVNRIGNHMSKTIRMDLATSEGARGRYARVCVEVDLSKPLLGKYKIGDRVLYVEYESLENVCFHCRMYGHQLVACLSLSPTDGPSDPVEQSQKVDEPSEKENDTGSWMTVTRRRLPKSSNKKEVNPKSNTNGSRFNFLRHDHSGDRSVKLVATKVPTPTVQTPKDPITQLTEITRKV
ncbi:hypothetical protein LINPERHAP1_LOCUS29622 [Linum perenne]